MSRRRTTAAGAVLLVLALATAAPAAAASPARGCVGPNVLVNPPALIDANSSPVATRNPRRERNLVIGHRVDRPRFSGMLQWSDDDGTTWRPTALPLPAGKDRPYAPDVAFGPDGTLYVLYVDLQGQGNDPGDLWLARSDDGGQTLGAPVRVAGGLTFQAHLAVGRNGTVHITWMAVEGVATLAVTGPTRIVAVHSGDGGRTFSPPIAVSDPARTRVGAATPVIDGSGRLQVLYEDFRGDSRDFGGLDGPPWDQPFALVLTTSADGGKTFSPGVEVEARVVVSRRFLVYLPELPSLAAGPGERLYVTWTDARHGDDDVLLRRSDDGGRTWRAPVRVNDDRVANSASQLLPHVAVDPEGRVEVVFLDRRRDPANILTDAFLATSTDGGRSFTNQRLTSTAFDARIGPVTTSAIGVELGSRLALTPTRRGALAAWTDTRLGTVDTGRQDIAAVTITFGRRSASGSDRRPLLLLAGVVAALAATDIALVLRFRRARTGIVGPVDSASPGTVPADQPPGEASSAGSAQV